MCIRDRVEDVFRDKLGEYMALWKKFQELDEDIEARGVTVMDERRGMLVENRSVSPVSYTHLHVRREGHHPLRRLALAFTL